MLHVLEENVFTLTKIGYGYMLSSTYFLLVYWWNINETHVVVNNNANILLLRTFLKNLVERLQL